MRSLAAGAWPCTSSYQEKVTGCPAFAFSIVSALSDIGRHREMRHRIPGRHHGEQNRDHDHRGGVFGEKSHRADNKAGGYSHGCRRIAMSWTRELGQGAVSGVTTKAKGRHWPSSPPL